MNPWALATLDRCGLTGLIGELNAVNLRRLEISCGGRRAKLRLPMPSRSLSREVLDSTLVQAAVLAGCHFLPGARVVSSRVERYSRRVVVRVGQESIDIQAGVVVAADGLGGRLALAENPHGSRVDSASRVGAGAIASHAPLDYKSGIIYMACGRHGYAGLVRLEDGRLNIAAALDPRAVSANGRLGHAVHVIMDEAKFPPISDIEKLDWRGTPALTRRLERVAGIRVFAAGDATGYVEPFTGEGMAWALASAEALVPLAVQDWAPSLTREWMERHRRLIAKRRRNCHLVTRILRRPSLTAAAIAMLSLAPALASPIFRSLRPPYRISEATPL
jgi:flavin-dependent dehydrogenase